VALSLDRRTVNRFRRKRRAKVTLRATVQTNAGLAVNKRTVTLLARRTPRRFRR
jgi:hypothetical protein